VIVAQEQEHATLGIGAEQIAVADRVARAVDTGPLAVPDREDAVEAPLAGEVHLLGALAGGRGQILVDRRLVDDVVRVEQRAGRLELLIVGAQRRAAIAGDVARRVPSGAPIAPLLLERQANERLDAGQINPALLEPVLVVERDGEELRHEGLGS
jgi:hypothetical protein